MDGHMHDTSIVKRKVPTTCSDPSRDNCDFKIIISFSIAQQTVKSI
ncbi:unnamed protein product [Rhodiola kirilowii]